MSKLAKSEITLDFASPSDNSIMQRESHRRVIGFKLEAHPARRWSMQSGGRCLRDLRVSPCPSAPFGRSLPGTAAAGPVSPCPRRSRNLTSSNRRGTRSSCASDRDSRRKRGAVFAAPGRSTPSGPSCGKSPDGTADWGCSSVGSGPRSSSRIGCCRSEQERASDRGREERRS